MLRIGDEIVAGDLTGTYSDCSGWTTVTMDKTGVTFSPSATISTSMAIVKEKSVRTLYEVYLVHRETLEIVFERVVAKSEEAAMIKAAMKNKIEDVDLYDWTAVDILTLSDPDDD
jgi:hypothetical protein